MELRNKDYALVMTNCIANGAAVPPNIEMWRCHVHGGTITSASNQISTEGIIRLLNGEKLELHPADKKLLKTNKAEIQENLSILELPDIDYLTHVLWSPYFDQVGRHTSARCSDNTVYPFVPIQISQNFDAAWRLFAKPVVYAMWREFIRLTRWIPNRAMILYPVGHMHESTIKQRMIEMNDKAKQIFDNCGWQIFEVENPAQETCDGSAWFGHLTAECRVPVHKDLLLKFFAHRVRRPIEKKESP